MTTSAHNDWVRMAGLLLFLFLLSCGRVSGQTFQFLPEVDVFSRIHPDFRFNFQAKETREAGDPTQAEIGPGFDFFLKPLAPLRRIAALDPDEAKSRSLQLSAGFRYVPSPDKPHTERLIVAATARLPFVWRILVSDRNRMDLDWSQNKFTWRYRNRLTLERRLAVRSYRLGPYVSAEGFYESQYQKWNTTALYAGCLLPLSKHFQFDPYYEHQNITSKRPNQQLNQFGLILNMYF